MLMNARRKAVKKKFLQYVSDPKYRRSYRNRIYYNVNLDVPSDDMLYMQDDTSFSETNEYVQNFSNYFNNKSLFAKTPPVPVMHRPINQRQFLDQQSPQQQATERKEVRRELFPPEQSVNRDPIQNNSIVQLHKVRRKLFPSQPSCRPKEDLEQINRTPTQRIHRTPSFKTRPHRRLLVIL